MAAEIMKKQFEKDLFWQEEIRFRNQYFDPEAESDRLLSHQDVLGEKFRHLGGSDEDEIKDVTRNFFCKWTVASQSSEDQELLCMIKQSDDFNITKKEIDEMTSGLNYTKMVRSGRGVLNTYLESEKKLSCDIIRIIEPIEYIYSKYSTKE
jgi:hypothetical protein